MFNTANLFLCASKGPIIAFCLCILYKWSIGIRHFHSYKQGRSLSVMVVYREYRNVLLCQQHGRILHYIILYSYLPRRSVTANFCF